MLKKAAAAAIFCLAFVSCKTTNFFIPGAKKAELESIYVEYYNIAEEYSKIPNYQKAAQFYVKATADKSFSNAAYFKAARSYALAKDWNNALDIFLKIQKKDKDNVSVKESLAYIYAMSGDYEKSERLYLEVISENPDLPQASINYAIVLTTLEKFQEAAAELERIKAKFPDEEKIPALEEKINAALNPPSDDSEGRIPEELMQPELD